MSEKKDKLSEIAELKKPFLEKFTYYAPRCLKIQIEDTTKGSNLIPFTLKTTQRVMEAVLGDIRAKGRLVRVIILKARRQGLSTWVGGRAYWHTSNKFNRYAVTVTHEPEATDFIFKMTKRFHNLVPPIFQPATKQNNAKLLEFNNKEGTGLDSAFRVGTAGKSDYGSGQLIHYLHCCMAPDTPVIMADGKEKPISDIKAGDKLLTHTGSFAEVQLISWKHSDNRPDKDKTIIVTSWNGGPIEMTPQHKVFTSEGWVEAGNLIKGKHKLAMPARRINKFFSSSPLDNKHRSRPQKGGVSRIGPDRIDFNYDVGFLVGYYLAEGCVSSKTPNGYARVTFTLHRDEIAYAKKVASIASPWCKTVKEPTFRKGKKTANIDINSIPIANWLYENFGRVESKHIPDWVFNCSKEFCRGIVHGYLLGDGSKGIGGAHQNYKNNSISASSIRESLTYQVRDLVASLGYGWGRISHKDEGFYYGRNCKKQWTVCFNGEGAMRLRMDMGLPYAELGAKSKQATRYEIKDGFVWLPIKKIEEGTQEYVVDIAVDHKDHSFRTRHFAVSNSEVAKWPKETATDLLTSLLQTVPKDPDTEIYLESTARGIGGEFHTRFKGARFRYIAKINKEGKISYTSDINEDAEMSNQYSMVFIPWYIDPKYQMPVSEYEGMTNSVFRLDEEERQMKEEHNLMVDHLVWRRWAVSNLCGGNIETFWQEYPTTWEEAFLTSGNPLFDNKKLSILKKNAPAPTARYDLLYHNDQWAAEKNGKLKVWKEPEVGRHYIVGADVAEGLVKGDFSCADVIDHLTGEQVAHWHGKVDIDLFAKVLFHLGKRYNNAWLGPEKNNAGIGVINRLHNDMEYGKLYVEQVPDPPNKSRKRYGWVTNQSTKYEMTQYLIEDVREDSHGIKCAETFEEMMSFKEQENGKREADAGCFDDRVMSLAIAKILRVKLPPPRRTNKPTGGFQPKGRIGRSNKGRQALKGIV